MFSMTNVILTLKNFHEALIYSIQSNLWGMNCVSLLKDLLTDKSKYLFKNDEAKFYKLAQVYFDVCRFYSLTLKNTGDIFQSLDQFDQAKKYYLMAKIFLHGNFQDFGVVNYSNQNDQVQFEDYRNFVTNCLFGVQPENAIDQ